MLHEQIKNKIKESMMSRDEVSLLTYRGMVSSFTNELVSKGKKPNEFLTDEEAIIVISRLAKQRKDSIDQFKNGGREDLAKKEEAELAILELYLPKMMDRNEVEKIVKAKKEEMGIVDIKEKGKLMSMVMKDLKGRADGTIVKEVLDALF